MKSTVSEVEIDQALVGHAEFLGQRLEVCNS